MRRDRATPWALPSFENRGITDLTVGATSCRPYWAWNHQHSRRPS